VAFTTDCHDHFQRAAGTPDSCRPHVSLTQAILVLTGTAVANIDGASSNDGEFEMSATTDAPASTAKAGRHTYGSNTAAGSGRGQWLAPPPSA
jgi:hypothetical protein